MAICYVKRSEIDTVKWDQCIKHADNGLIYGYSFYLDAMCDHWDALVLNDYDAVMPLPWRKKYGMTYVYTPPFIQQLGVFTSLKDQQLTLSFLQFAEKHFRFGDYFINYNSPQLQQKCTNFILDLRKEYKDIVELYKADLRKNLKKAQQFKLQYRATENFTLAIDLYKRLYHSKLSNVTEENFDRLKSVCVVLQQKGGICIREIRNEKEDLLAISLFLKDQHRFYLIASSTTEAGRALKATHYLLDCFIREFAGQNLLLDFEGSDLPGVYHFYQNFGSINEPYYFYRWNKLPWPLYYFKK